MSDYTPRPTANMHLRPHRNEVWRCIVAEAYDLAQAHLDDPKRRGKPPEFLAVTLADGSEWRVQLRARKVKGDVQYALVGVYDPEELLAWYRAKWDRALRAVEGMTMYAGASRYLGHACDAPGERGTRWFHLYTALPQCRPRAYIEVTPIGGHLRRARIYEDGEVEL